MDVEATSAFDRIDDHPKGSWHAIGDLARTHLATLAAQMPAQGGVFPDQLHGAEAVMRRAA